MKSRKTQKNEERAVREADGKPVVRISVRRLVEFILRSGDIDDRGAGVQSPEAALAGGRIHRKLQKAAEGDFRAEVPLSFDAAFDDFVIRVEGRADGIWGMGALEAAKQTEGVRKAAAKELIIEEIKGMYLDVTALEDPFPLHLAQAKCYACIFAEKEGLSEIGVRMTYANLDSGKTKRFDLSFSFADLAAWFSDLTEKYAKWVRMDLAHKKSRDKSMEGLAFPFPYRKGQRGLAAAVYKTVRDGKSLFLMAPTGVGKTMSCVFPAVIAMGQGLGDRIFYLTGKNETLVAPEQAFRILLERGLDLKMIRLTSKEKICPLSEPSCNPDDCLYAKGHFDRAPDAVFSLLTSGPNVLDSGVFRQQAEGHRVCPFQLELDAASFCDAILCDYNYVFDPNARLERFFGTGVQENYIFLIDEAHNLVERGRDMYSASLSKSRLLAAKRLINHKSRKLARAMERVNAELLSMKHALENEPDGTVLGTPYRLLTHNIHDTGDVLSKNKVSDHGSAGINAPEKGDSAGKAAFCVSSNAEGGKHTAEPDLLRTLNASAARLYGEMQDFFRESRDGETKEKLLDFYFELRDFIAAAQYLGPDYQAYTCLAGDPEKGRDAKPDLEVRYFCANPAEYLAESLGKGRAAVFFSATLLPIDYYKKMLSVDPDAPAIYAESPFDTARRLLLIGGDVSTRYNARGRETYRKIAAYISAMARAKAGNYLVFFPSYKMMRDVFEVYKSEFDTPEVNYVCQSGGMREDEREIFMENFYENPEKSLVGFAVMGGMFSEGIDLAGTRLIGAAVIGTGLPQVSVEREILRLFYGGDGFDYAYRFPGMNKVEQAAGRVIRTADDTGVILLIDSRFTESANRRLFPREWRDAKMVNTENVADELAAFWGEMDKQ